MYRLKMQDMIILKKANGQEKKFIIETMEYNSLSQKGIFKYNDLVLLCSFHKT